MSPQSCWRALRRRRKSMELVRLLRARRCGAMHQGVTQRATVLSQPPLYPQCYQHSSPCLSPQSCWSSCTSGAAARILRSKHLQDSRSPTSWTRRLANSATCVKPCVLWSTLEQRRGETLERANSCAPLRSARQLDAAPRRRSSLYRSLANLPTDASFRECSKAGGRRWSG